MKIVDLSDISTYPPRSGGQIRIFNLNFELSKYHTIFQFSSRPYIYNMIRFSDLLLHNHEIKLKSSMRKITEQYVEYTFSNPLFLLIAYITSKCRMSVFTPTLLDPSSFYTLKRKIIQSDLVQIESPWLFDWIYKHIPKNKPMILDEHNVYYSLSAPHAREMERKESNAVEKADGILVCSEDDSSLLCNKYNVEKSKVHVIPNGVNVSSFKVLSQTEKEELKRQFGFVDKKIVLFVGSRHLPNIDAVKVIHSIASKVTLKNIIFVIAGSVGNWVSREKQDNILYTGYVGDISPYFMMADIAINPMLSGSGTNLKMLEYLASGLPVITTEIGARGLLVKNEEHVLISTVEDFPQKIEELISDTKKCILLKKKGRMLVEDHYDWKIIARKLSSVYGKLG